MINKLELIGIVGLDFTANEFSSTLKEMSGDVTINLTSPGGLLFEGIEFYNSIREYKGGKVTIIIGSLVASIASYFAMAADEIIVNDNSSLMIHNSHIDIYGDYVALEKTLKVMIGTTQIMREVYASKSGKSLEVISEMMDNETFMHGANIVKHGFADSVLESGLELNEVHALETARDEVDKCKGNCKRVEFNDIIKISAYLRVEKKQKELYKKAQKIMEEVKYENA